MRLLSHDEIFFVSGGESPTYAINGRGAELRLRSASEVKAGADAANVIFTAMGLQPGPTGTVGRVGSAIAQAVSWAAGVAAGTGNPTKTEEPNVKKK